jgi:SAM-dependent methyltransferase
VAQAYSESFARYYNRTGADFARQLAPRIYAWHQLSTGSPPARVLDVGCGTGQLAHYFLDRGCRVTGIDLSPSMLEFARQNNADFIASGVAEFIEGDATNFTVDPTFDLAVSTFDAINHLPDFAALRSCFASVGAVTDSNGRFVFDLNTRGGIRRWNGVLVQDGHDQWVLQRGLYDGGDRALMMITGFSRVDDGHYERFEECVYNTLFDLEQVLDLLAETGWVDAYCARLDDLATAVQQPEALDRAVVIARKP